MGNVFGLVVLGLAGVVGTVGVRRVVIFVAETYRKARVAWLRLRGTTAETECEKRLVLGKVWDEYCDSLKAAGAGLLSPGCPTDPFTQAEGYRYLTRLIRGSLEVFMECADTNAPKFCTVVDGGRLCPVKLGSDNPDNYYQSASISGKKSYIISVQRGTVKSLHFASQAGVRGSGEGMKMIEYKSASEFEQDKDGYFEIYVGNDKPTDGKNWLRTVPEPEQGMIMVFQTREDKKREQLAHVEIRCVSGGENAGLPSPCSAASVEQALQNSAIFVGGVPLMFARWAHNFQKHCNELPLFDQETSNKAGGNPNIRYYHSYWKLEDDQALIISAKPPPVETWNFQLNNHWMESLDYNIFNVHVNRASARMRDDGTVWIVVTAQDPHKVLDEGSNSTINWLCTAGHRFGTMSFRWVHPKVDDRDVPVPTTKVVQFCDLAKSIAPAL